MKSHASEAVSVLTDHWLNRDDPIRAYRGNPMIGALGPILTTAATRNLLTQAPPYDPAEKQMPAHLRAHAMCALQQLFIPTPMHEDVVHEIGIMIRQGYIHRNPLDPSYQRRTRADRVLLRNQTFPTERYRYAPLLGSKIVGAIGTGKSVSAEIATSVFQRVYDHCYEIDGVRFATKQVAVLKLNVFQDASLKALGEEYFERLSESTGEDLAKRWSISSLNGNSIQFAMYEAAQEYNLGLLVVDEMQNIVAHGKGFKAVLRYFTRMMNCIGLPVLIIGSNAAITLLKEDECAARRFLGRIRQFKPLSKGDLWHAFFAKVCRYDYLRSDATAPKLREFETLVHDLTGGIPDFLIKLMTLAQYRVLGRKKEEITEAVLQETADQLFYTVQDRILEFKCLAPETKGLAKSRTVLENHYSALINENAARVGSEPLIDQTASDPIEIAGGDGKDSTPSKSTNGTGSRRHPIVAAASSTDKVATLRALGVLDPRP